MVSWRERKKYQVIFLSLLSKHYNFYAQLGQGCNNYSDDLPVLSELKRKLEKESQRRKPLDKYCLCRLMKHLDGAIRRAEGDNGVIEIL